MVFNGQYEAIQNPTLGLGLHFEPVWTPLVWTVDKVSYIVFFCCDKCSLQSASERSKI